MEIKFKLCVIITLEVVNMEYLKKSKIKFGDYGHFLILVVVLDFFLVSNLLRIDPTLSSIEDAGVKLDMVGDVNQILSINSDYIDSGVKVTLDDKELTLDDIDYTVENNVDTNAVGDYQVKYHTI